MPNGAIHKHSHAIQPNILKDVTLMPSTFLEIKRRILGHNKGTPKRHMREEYPALLHK